MIDADLMDSPEVQAGILVLASYAIGAALEETRALEEQGYLVTRGQRERIAAALNMREFAWDALAVLSEPSFSNEEIVAAAKLSGRSAVHEAGPFARVPLN